MEADAYEVIRGGEVQEKMMALNHDDPAALAGVWGDLKTVFAEAVRDHSAL